MAGDAGDFHDVETLLEQSRRGLVVQIVKAQVLDAGPANGASEGAFDRFGGQTREHLAVDVARISEIDRNDWSKPDTKWTFVTNDDILYKSWSVSFYFLIVCPCEWVHFRTNK